MQIPWLGTDRLHLLLAILSASTTTWWGVGTALLVVLLMVARAVARRHTLRPPATRFTLSVPDAPPVEGYHAA